MASDEAAAAPVVDRPVADAARSGSRQFQLGVAVLGSVRTPLGPEPGLAVGVGVTLQWAESWLQRLEVSVSRLETGQRTRHEVVAGLAREQLPESPADAEQLMVQKQPRQLLDVALDGRRLGAALSLRPLGDVDEDGFVDLEAEVAGQGDFV